MSFIRDEQNGLSMARLLLVSTSLFIFGLVVVDAMNRWGIGTAVWSLLGSMEISFAAWAAGPRIAQYLGPQIGQIAEGIGAGKATDRFGGPSSAHFDDGN